MLKFSNNNRSSKIIGQDLSINFQLQSKKLVINYYPSVTSLGTGRSEQTDTDQYKVVQD